jgi:tetratricopeptide (TPR) repeat protein
VNLPRRAETPASDAELVRLNRLFERNPTSTIFARLADTYLSLGQADKAVIVCRRGLKYRPSYVTGHIVLGRALIDTDALSSAEEEFQKVLTLEHDHLAALQYLAVIADRTGDSEQVQVIQDRLSVLNPFQFGKRLSEPGIAAGQEESVPSHPVVEVNEGSDQTDVEDSGAEFPFVSLTLARLYARQGHKGQAERVVRLVSPGDADDILDRISHESAK